MRATKPKTYLRKRGEQTQTEVLKVLRRARGPLSAYDVLGALRVANPKVAPQTIYRALAALMEKGCVHRVESLNAFMACRRDRHHHAAILSICEDCGAVEESAAQELLHEVANVLQRSGFEPLRHVIEVHGLCASCGRGEARPR